MHAHTQSLGRRTRDFSFIFFSRFLFWSIHMIGIKMYVHTSYRCMCEREIHTAIASTHVISLLALLMSIVCRELNRHTIFVLFSRNTKHSFSFHFNSFLFDRQKGIERNERKSDEWSEKTKRKYQWYRGRETHTQSIIGDRAFNLFMLETEKSAAQIDNSFHYRWSVVRDDAAAAARNNAHFFFDRFLAFHSSLAERNPYRPQYNWKIYYCWCYIWLVPVPALLR